MLQSKKVEVQSRAAMALGYLADENPDNQAAIIKTRVVPRLVALLKAEDRRLQRWAVGALALLTSMNPAGTTAIIKAGAIPSIVALLGLEDDKLQEWTIKALYVLSFDHKDAIRKAGAIPGLVEALRVENPVMLEFCTFTLNNLADNNSANQNAIREAGAVPRLARLISSPNPTIQQAAIKALCRLALDNSVNCAVIGGLAGTIPELVDKLRSDNPALVESSLYALIALCRIELNRRKMLEAGAFQEAQRLLLGHHATSPLVAHLRYNLMGVAERLEEAARLAFQGSFGAIRGLASGIGVSSRPVEVELPESKSKTVAPQ